MKILNENTPNPDAGTAISSAWLLADARVLSGLSAELFIGILPVSAVHAHASFPTSDSAKAQDLPRLQRYEGSFLVSGDAKVFDEYRVASGPVVRSADEQARDEKNNRMYDFKATKKNWRAPLDKIAATGTNYSVRDVLASPDGKYLTCDMFSAGSEIGEAR